MLLQALTVIRDTDLKRIHEFSRIYRGLHTSSMSVLILEYQSKRTKTVLRTFSTSRTPKLFEKLHHGSWSNGERFLDEVRTENREIIKQNDVQKV